MADSNVLGLTAATSQTVASSVLFFGLLPDLTPVAVPGNELQTRISMPSPGVLVRHAPTQEVAGDLSRVILTISSVIYDDDAWWDSASTNVLRVPNDKYDMAQAWWFYETENNSPDNTADNVYTDIRYTDATSNDKGYSYPLKGVGSASTNSGLRRRSIPSESGGGTPKSTYQTVPFYISSGDQFTVNMYTNLVTTVTVNEVWWSIRPTRLKI